ncbi:hypothetical protein CAP31_11185 [Sulfuriferula sp. AH1]|nr:hypothetical protein CAP31_11185 [Sulfuriferula sp. AH1]
MPNRFLIRITWLDPVSCRRRIAPTDAPAVLSGESDTQRELVAEAVHGTSGRCHGPFVPADCSGLTVAPFESGLFGYEKGAPATARADANKPDRSGQRRHTACRQPPRTVQMLKRASLLADGDDRKGLAQKLGISERTLYRKLKN